MGFCEGGAKARQVSVFEVVRGHVDVGLMTGGSGPLVYGVVFGCGDDARVAGIVALHAGDEGDRHSAGEERIFTWVLSPSPARIAENVDVGSPEGEAEESFMLIATNGLVVLGARFSGDG